MVLVACIMVCIVSVMRRHDARMLMTECCTHLAGLEVEILLAVGVDDDRAMRLGEDRLVLQASHVTGAFGRNHCVRDNPAGCLAIHGTSLPTVVICMVNQTIQKVKCAASRDAAIDGTADSEKTMASDCRLRYEIAIIFRVPQPVVPQARTHVGRCC